MSLKSDQLFDSHHRKIAFQSADFFREFAQEAMNGGPNNNLLNPEYFDQYGISSDPVSIIKDEIEPKQSIIYNPGIPAPTEESQPKFVKPTNATLLKTLLYRHFGEKAHPSKAYKRSYIKYIRKTLLPNTLQLIDEIIIQSKIYTVQDYIDQSIPSKRKFLESIKQKVSEHNHDYNEKYIPFLKTEEQLFGPDSSVKGRCVWDQPDYAKLIGCAANKNILHILKQIFPEFISGLNIGDTCQLIQEAANSIPDPVFVATDGSRHDSQQHAWMLREIDNKIFPYIIKQIAARMQLTTHQSEQIINAITEEIMGFKAFHKRQQRNLMLSGKCKGTVISGHPTKTTAGNTLRLIFLILYMQSIQKIPSTHLKFFVSGDDCLMIVSSKYLSKLLDGLKKLTTTDVKVRKGIGYILKKIGVSQDYFEFLSKTGFYTQTATLYQRTAQRLITGSNYTTSTQAMINPAVFNHCISSQLAQVSLYHPVYQDYLQLRYKKLDHQVGTINNNDLFWSAIRNNITDLNPQTFINYQFYSSCTNSWKHQHYDYSIQFYNELPERDLYIGYKKRLSLGPGQPIFLRADVDTEIIQKQKFLNTLLIPQMVEQQLNNLTDKLNQVLALNTQIAQYNPPNSQAEIQQRIQYYQRNNPQKRRQNFVKKINDSEFKGKKATELLTKLAEGNTDLLNELKEIRKTANPFVDTTNSQLKTEGLQLSYNEKSALKQEANQDMMQYGMQKFGTLQKYQQAIQLAEQFCKELQTKYPDFKPDMWQIKEILDLDDMNLGLTVLRSLVAQFGPQIIKAIYHKLVPLGVQAKISNFLNPNTKGGDEGLNPIDYGNSAIQPYIISSQPGLTNFATDIPIPNDSKTLIDTNQLATLLNPYRYSYRVQPLYPKKVAIGQGTLSLAITTNAAGNAAATIFPFSALQAAQCLNAADLNLGAGTGTVSSSVVGPSNTGQSSVSYWRMTGVQSNIIFSTSQNVNGVVQMAYTDSPMATAFLPQNQITSSPYYLTGNSYSTYRMIFPYSQSTETFQATLTNNGNPSITIQFSGFPVSTQIATLQISYVMEYTPTVSAAPLVAINYATPSPQGLELMRTVWSQFPLLVTLTQKDADLVCEALKGQMIPYQQVISQLQKLLMGITPPTQLIYQTAEQGLGDLSILEDG